MKKFKNLALSAMILAGTALSAQAQDYSALDYSPYPYAFITLQGGAQTTFTNYSNGKLITPIGAISIGSMYNPIVGTRLNVNGGKAKGGLKAQDVTYDFKYFNTDLDLMFNLTNAIMPSDHVYPLNVYLLGGIGLTYAWDNSDFSKKNVAVDHNVNSKWDEDRLVHNFRLGTMLEARLSKHFSVNLEVNVNHMHDRFNSKLNGKGDWQLQALAGVTFSFGHRAKDVSSMSSTSAQDSYNNGQYANMAAAGQMVATGKEEKKVAPKPKPAAPVVAPVKKTVSPKKVEMEQVNLFFQLNQVEIQSSELAKLRKVAEWMKANPNAKICLKGYADAETGTPVYNKKLSAKRTSEVVRCLVNDFGINKNRIESEAKGDSEQPFAENDKNRVVIAIAK